MRITGLVGPGSKADDGAWYRIEAYPEYVRSSTPPLPHFLTPPWEPEPSPFMEAVHRFRTIDHERKPKPNADMPG
jgi:hypothetical protein